MNTPSFTFPVGYYRFHKKQLYNFQLDRWNSLGYLSYDDAKSAGQKIIKFTDWKSIMIEYANKKEKEGKFIDAALFWRFPILVG